MIDRLMDRILRTAQVLAGIAFTSLFLVSLLRIVLRNLLGITWFWIDGFSRISFIWSIFLGASALYATDDHLVMDFFVARMKAVTRRRLAILFHLAFLVFVSVIIYYGVLVFRVRLRITYTYWNVPTGYAYLAAPVCGVLMLLFCLRKLGQFVRTRAAGPEPDRPGGTAEKGRP